MSFFKPGSKNLITDISDLYVGNAENEFVNSGTTVLTCEQCFVASCKVLGGAPGTRETDLLEPDKLVEKIDAIVLSGGSVFGLDSASEIANQLRIDNKGYPVGEHKVPIVPGAIIFDLINGGNKLWDENPYYFIAKKAYQNLNTNFELGSFGAGKGALTGNLKGGLGSASLIVDNKFTVGALMVVNSFGNVVVGDSPHFWAAPFEFGNEFGGLGSSNEFNPSGSIRKASEDDFKKNTVIGIVATDAKLSKSQCKALATSSHDGISRAVFPSHTNFDGDAIFSVSTGEKKLNDNTNDILMISQAASICVSRSIARGVYHAKTTSIDILPSFKSKFDTRDQ